MYFYPRPKETKEDLFGRRGELKQFCDILSNTPLVIITGPRRTGKTSFMNVALKESGYPYIKLNLLALEELSRAHFLKELQKAFNRIDRRWYNSILDLMKQIESVTIQGYKINFNWDNMGKSGTNLAELFDKIDEWAGKNKIRFLAAFDELQLIMEAKEEIQRLFAYIADCNYNVTLIVTGSEVGLVLDFLGLENPESYLYGRHFNQIRMQNFSSEEAISFLKEGFKQIRLECPNDVLRYAAERLGGIIGWLTEFGAGSRDQKKMTLETVDEFIIKAGNLARKEAAELAELSHHCGIVLNFLANTNVARWTQIRDVLEAKEKKKLADAVVTDTLRILLKNDFIFKANGNYSILDPVLISGLKRNPLT